VQTIEAIIDAEGNVTPLGPLRGAPGRRAIVTVLDDPPISANETALLSEDALAVDWSRPEEDEAWSYLQLAP
jgi:hypothetical protein